MDVVIRRILQVIAHGQYGVLDLDRITELRTIVVDEATFILRFLFVSVRYLYQILAMHP